MNNIIVKRLKKSYQLQRITLFFAFFLNACIVLSFLSFSLGILNNLNMTLSEDDQVNLAAQMGSITSITIIAILFMQWVVSILMKELFMERKNFNLLTRLLGGRESDLSSFYFSEMIQMNLIGFIIGIPAGIVVIKLIELYTGDTITVTPLILIITLAICIISFLACYFISLGKLMHFKILDFLREDLKIISVESVGLVDIILIIVLIILRIGLDVFLMQNSDLQLTSILLIKALSNIILIIFGFKFIYLGLNKLLLISAKKLNSPEWIISQFNILGYFKKTKSIAFITLVSFMITCGFVSLFETIRNSIVEYGEAKINFASRLHFDNFIPVEDNNDLFYQIDIKFNVDDTGNTAHIAGIDSNFPNIDGLSISKEIMPDGLDFKVFDDAKCDGIIVPHLMISAKDIGTYRTFVINDKSYKFKVIGAYYATHFEQQYFYASNKYIERLFNKENLANTVFVKANSHKLPSFNNEKFTIETKEDIINKSRGRIVQSTEMVDIAGGLIYLVSMVMIISFFIITKRNNIVDISRLRSYGFSSSRIILLCFYQTFVVIVIGALSGFILSYGFASMAFVLIFAGTKEYLVTPIFIPISTAIILFVPILMTSFLAYILSVKQAFGKNYIEILRENGR